MSRIARTTVAGLTVAWICFFCSGCLTSLVLLHPTHDPRISGDALTRTIPVDGKLIEIWTTRTVACEGTEPKAFVLHFVGNVSRADDDTPGIARVWSKWPVEVWGVNYPSYGGSAGPSRIDSLPPTALAAYDALKKVAGDRPIFLSSNSIGGTCSIYVAGKRPAAGLVIQNPPPLRRLIVGHYGWWNLWLLATPTELGVPHDLNTTETGPLATAPACFVFSTKDRIIPPFFHQLVFDAYGGPKHIIDVPNETHDLHVDGPQTPRVQAWIGERWKQLFPTAATTAAQ